MKKRELSKILIEAQKAQEKLDSEKYPLQSRIPVKKALTACLLGFFLLVSGVNAQSLICKDGTTQKNCRKHGGAANNKPKYTYLCSDGVLRESCDAPPVVPFEVAKVTVDHLEAGSRNSCDGVPCVTGSSEKVNYLLRCPFDGPGSWRHGCPVPVVGKVYQVQIAGRYVCFTSLDLEFGHCYLIELATKDKIYSLEPIPPVNITIQPPQ